MTRRAWLATNAVVWTVVVGLAAVAVLVVQTWRPAPFDAWPDSTFAAVVFDRDTDRPVVSYRADEQFRSASLVKLLIALDVLERPGATAADRELVGSMLRASDDDAASLLWVRQGDAAIVERARARLGLADTEAPERSSSWGYTATSAADVVRVYRHLLDRAPVGVRDVVLEQLRDTTRCAVDGRDQYFGIPRAADGPWVAKQGWSGFGEPDPATSCTPAPQAATDPDADNRLAEVVPRGPSDTGSDPDVDESAPALHTTGLVGERDELIVVVLSLHPEGTSFDDAARRLDDVTGALLVEAREPR